MTDHPTTTEELLDYWPGNIPFKGSLVSEDGTCMCAQGQVLHFLGGLSVKDLRSIGQCQADERVAELLGISTAHSALLRIVNDSWDGAPMCVIRNPEQVLGDNAITVLAFWRHLDQITPAQWKAAWAAAWAAAVAAAGAAARAAAVEAAWEAAVEAAGEAAVEAAWEAAVEAAVEVAWATNEIQGAAVLRANNQPFFFLPMFGFANPEEI